MADTPTNLEQKLLLIIEEQLKNVGAALKHLDAIKKTAREASASIDKYEEATKAAAKSTEHLQKVAFKTGQITKKLFRGMAQGVGIIGGIAGATAAAIAVTSKMNQGYLRLAMVSRDSNKALVDLRTTYADVASQTSAMAISIQDASDVLADFSEQSLTAAMALGPELGRVMTDVTNQIADVFGPDQAKQMMKSFSTAFPDRAAFARMMTQYEFGAPEMFREIERMAPEAINQFRQMATVFQNFKNITDPNVAAVKSFNSVLARLRAMAQDLADQIMRAFGPEIKVVLDIIATDVIPRIKAGIGDLLAAVIKTKDTWIVGFETIGKTLMWIFDIITKLPKPIQVLGAALLFPGVGKVLATIITSIISIGASAISAAIATGGLTAALTAARVAATGLMTALGPIGWIIAGLGILAGVIAGLDWFLSDEDVAATEAAAKSVEDGQKAMDEARKSIEDMRRSAEEASKTPALDPADIGRFKQLQERIELVSKGISGLTSQVRSLQDILMFGGFQFNLQGFGEAAGFTQLLADNIAKSIPRMRELGRLSLEAAQIDLDAAENALAAAKTTEERRAALDSVILAHRRIGEAIKTSAEAEALVSQVVESRLSKLQINVDLSKQLVDLHRADLDISKALYGTPALGVQAMLRVTKEMQRQKEFVQDQLDIVNQEIAQRGALPGLIKRQRDLAQQVKRITAEQLNMVKELRDGYLDAVQAQAFASGEFEKIIIDQEHNLGMALEKGLVKANYLIGQVGEAAAAADAVSYRFSAAGYGALERTGGGEFGRAELEERMGTALANIQDDTQKRATKEAMDLVMGIHDDTARVYADATQHQVDAMYDTTQDYVDASDRVVDALNAYAGRAATATAVAGGIRGGVNEDIVAGEAARGAAEGAQKALRGMGERAPRVMGVVTEPGERIRIPRPPRLPEKIAEPPMPAVYEGPSDIYSEIRKAEIEFAQMMRESLKKDVGELRDFFKRFNEAGLDFDERMAALEAVKAIRPGDRQRAEKAIRSIDELYESVGKTKLEVPPIEQAAEKAAAEANKVQEGLAAATPAKPKLKVPELTFEAPELPTELGEAEKVAKLTEHVLNTYAEGFNKNVQAIRDANSRLYKAEREKADANLRLVDARSKALQEREISGRVSTETTRLIKDAEDAVAAGDKAIKDANEQVIRSQEQSNEFISRFDSERLNVLNNYLMNLEEEHRSAVMELDRIRRDEPEGVESQAYQDAFKRVRQIGNEAVEAQRFALTEIINQASARLGEQAKVKLPTFLESMEAELGTITIKDTGFKLAPGSEIDLRDFLAHLETERSELQEKLSESVKEQTKALRTATAERNYLRRFRLIRDVAELNKKTSSFKDQLKKLDEAIGEYKSTLDVLEQTGLPPAILEQQQLLDDYLKASEQDVASADAEAMADELRAKTQEFVDNFGAGLGGALLSALVGINIKPPDVPKEIKIAAGTSIPEFEKAIVDFDLSELQELKEQIDSQLLEIRAEEADLEEGEKLAPALKELNDELIQQLAVTRKKIQEEQAAVAASVPAAEIAEAATKAVKAPEVEIPEKPKELTAFQKWAKEQAATEVEPSDFEKEFAKSFQEKDPEGFKRWQERLQKTQAERKARLAKAAKGVDAAAREGAKSAEKAKKTAEPGMPKPVRKDDERLRGVPRLTTQDVSQAENAKKAAKKQESGLRRDAGYAIGMVGKQREDILDEQTTREKKRIEKDLAKTREENAKIYDEQQADEMVKRQAQKAREEEEKWRAAEQERQRKAAAIANAERQHQAGKLTAEELEERKRKIQAGERVGQAQEGRGLTHGARRRAGSAAGAGARDRGTAGTGMGTVGDRIHDAADFLKKAAKALIEIFDDIDELASEDRGVQYTRSAAQTGGNAMNTG
jgi:hypothetical protein